MHPPYKEGDNQEDEEDNKVDGKPLEHTNQRDNKLRQTQKTQGDAHHHYCKIFVA